MIRAVGSLIFFIHNAFFPKQVTRLPIEAKRFLLLLELSGWVTKMRSPNTTGVEFPGSGNSARQTTFLSSPHSVGRPEASVFPDPRGSPRQAGQKSGAAFANIGAASKTTIGRSLFIIRENKRSDPKSLKKN
jgi:hypothetical protein